MQQETRNGCFCYSRPCRSKWNHHQQTFQWEARQKTGLMHVQQLAECGETGACKGKDSFLQPCLGWWRIESRCSQPGGETTILHLILCMEIAMKHVTRWFIYIEAGRNRSKVLFTTWPSGPSLLILVFCLDILRQKTENSHKNHPNHGKKITSIFAKGFLGFQKKLHKCVTQRCTVTQVVGVKH